jgi:hypothetical protein
MKFAVNNVIRPQRACWRMLGAGIAIGWYLMLPPGTANAPNSTAPLAQWEISASFDSADACEKMRLARAGRYFAPSLGLKKNPHPTEQDFVAHCIATDDPRLAK